MFVTMEDETGPANIVVWVKVFEKFRRTMLSASMLAVRGRIQREGDVVHLVAHSVTDLSEELASVGRLDSAFPLPHGRGDEARRGGPGTDPRTLPRGFRPRDLVDPTLSVEPITVKTRNFK